nr:hypothetical protein [uncultured Kingella sp.]
MFTPLLNSFSECCHLCFFRLPMLGFKLIPNHQRQPAQRSEKPSTPPAPSQPTVHPLK